MTTSARMPAVDAMRLLAAVAVLLFHWFADRRITTAAFGWDADDVPRWLAGAGAYGFLGVPVFFVISGIVMVPSATRTGPARFLFARAVRLLPLFVPIATVSAVLAVVDGRLTSLTPAEALLSPLLLSDVLHVPWADPPFWTLWAELRFYALLAVVMVVARPLDVPRVVAAAYAWLAVALAARQAGAPTGVLTVALQYEYAPAFVLGLLLGAWRFGARALVVLPGVLVTTTLLGLHTADHVDLIAPDAVVPRSPTVGAALLVASVVVLAVATRVVLPARPTRLVQDAAGMTYPLYLVHLAWGATLAATLVELGAPPLGAAVGAGVVVLALAYVLGTVLEPRLRAALTRRLWDVHPDATPQPLHAGRGRRAGAPAAPAPPPASSV
ncbi:acyltransferase family protein [Cellulomonas marina]|uniref:Peptidoglycan/LPS O-acetylase OafA/YrhL, contains acyltransferase and SGNH-hydrolase domains n=1 Tax=Cellulomonas marina TaxID=988821 RepID=A0A1I1A266_9CELL|nr:acyltransferase [Cellulomonas marina]GIG30476.1 hypothetical protein Cma02nite_30760 [Cellulomonas marina]SFB32035.1 Peptidoglycan/LPS O-acetylase OafA/YrhL, contains acyltransferase and SGNH-hydrolase domains [Cellulomonas marina]